MRSKSKQKGAAFERSICKQLSLWVSGGKREDLFWRSAMSGGRATVHKDKSKVGAQAGDICSIDPMSSELVSKYYIECKNYKDLNFDSYIYSDKGILSSLIEETLKQSYLYNKKLMMIFKEARRPIMVATNSVILSSFGSRIIRVLNVNFFEKEDFMYIVPFEDIINNTYEDVRRHICQ